MFLSSLLCQALSLHWVFPLTLLISVGMQQHLPSSLQPRGASSLITLTGCWSSRMVRCLPPLYLSSWRCPRFKWTCVRPRWRLGVYRRRGEKKDTGRNYQSSLGGCRCCIWPSFLPFNTPANVKDFVSVFIPGPLHGMNKKWMNACQALPPKRSLCATASVPLIWKGFVFVLL